MKLEEFAREIDHVERVRDLWFLAIRYFQAQGVQRMSYQHMPPPGAPDAEQIRLATEGFPAEWVQRYVSERLCRIDPFALFSQQKAEPFFWSDIGRLKTISAEEKRYLDMLEAADLGDGLGIQVFGPNGRNGYCGLGLDASAPRISSLKIKEFQWVCQLAHLKYCAIIVPRLSKSPSLSAREAEVLAWVARGKSNGVIADILGLSPHTVDAYLRRIYLKLGVVDRMSAALRGMGVGLIQVEAGAA